MVRSVRAYYNKNVWLEWSRLAASPYRRLEFETTMRFVRKYLPKTGLILDAGGGPGRYAVELARKGYDLVLLDVSSANLSFARRQARKTGLDRHFKQYAKGTIEDLSVFPDGTFDAVLCLGGPLGHLVDKSARSRAVSELVRVCKGEGLIFVSVIGRLGAAVAHLTILSDHIGLPMFKKYALTGDYLGGYGFTAHHAYLVDELERDFQRDDIEVLGVVGLEGISSGHEKQVNALSKNPRLWKAWMRIHYETCTDKSIAGMSEHILIVCRRRSSD